MNRKSEFILEIVGISEDGTREVKIRMADDPHGRAAIHAWHTANRLLYTSGGDVQEVQMNWTQCEIFLHALKVRLNEML